MSAHEDIQIPDQIPIMALSGTVLFPHAIMPLYIFEERYREMLGDVLESDRLFAIFNFNHEADDNGNEWDLASIGTVGVVRAAHKNADGTTNLALQGIQRVRFLGMVQTSPYPIVRIEPFVAEELDSFQSEVLIPDILNLLKDEPGLANGIPDEYMEFLSSIDDSEAFFNMAAHTLCQCSQARQRMLELRPLEDRFGALEHYMIKQRDKLRFFRQLQGDTRDDEIQLN